VPHNGKTDESGFSAEERKLMTETCRILAAPQLRVSAQACRVPVAVGHYEQVWIRCERPVAVADVLALLADERASPLVRLIATPDGSGLSALACVHDRDHALAGRVRVDPRAPGGSVLHGRGRQPAARRGDQRGARRGALVPGGRPGAAGAGAAALKGQEPRDMTKKLQAAGDQHGRRRLPGAQRGDPGGGAARASPRDRGARDRGRARRAAAGHVRDGARADAGEVWPTLARGGTILGTTNRGNPFKYVGKDGEVRDLSDVLLARARELGIELLISVGGDGSQAIAMQLHRLGLPVIGVPKTIDNDLEATVETFGFGTAVQVVTDALDRLRTTAESHDRIMVLEVMGRDAGWIALHAGIAGGADVILIPELPYEPTVVAEDLRRSSRATGGGSR
jgi:hypothetical protein